MIGVVARAEDRGLGNLTWEAVRALQPDRVLVVTMGARDAGFVAHLDRFPGATVVEWNLDGQLPGGEVKRWLSGLDAVYCAETPYDERFPGWCAQLGVRCVIHAMPEFFRPAWAELPGVTWWNPTTWMQPSLPPGSRIMPVPVALDRWPIPASDRAEPDVVTFLHVVGHRTAGDRNGTISLANALRRATAPMRVRFLVQGSSFPTVRSSPQVEIEVVRGGVEQYWDLYEGADVLVMPRRYGGLSLPVQEAAGAGLALVMTDVEPNRTWPIVPVPVRQRFPIHTPAGDVTTVEADPRVLALTLDHLATRRADLLDHQLAARAWAEENDWDRWAPRWRQALCA